MEKNAFARWNSWEIIIDDFSSNIMNILTSGKMAICKMPPNYIPQMEWHQPFATYKHVWQVLSFRYNISLQFLLYFSCLLIGR